jgi:outer membrane protein TolC
VKDALRDMELVLDKHDQRDIDRIQNKKTERVIPTASAQVAAGIPADLLRRRPDIRRAEREVAAQSAQIGIAASQLYPHFSITGTLFLDAARFQDLFQSGSVAGSVGPSFRWDILNYGRLINNVRVQDARFEQLAVQYQNTVLAANAEAENALVSFLKAQQQVKYLKESTDAGREWLGLVGQRSKEGATDFLPVFIAQQFVTQQEDQLAVAEGTVAKSLIQLYKALGGGWQIRLGGPAPEPGAAAGPGVEPAPAPAPVKPAPPAAAPGAPRGAAMRSPGVLSYFFP